MQKLAHGVVFILLLAWPFSQAFAQDSWTPDQQGVLAAVQQLSEATAPGGSGADGYAAVLSGQFSRWTTGSSTVTGKQEWVEGIHEWFEDGWRVTDRDQTILEISVVGDFAFTRRIVEETYLGPDGDSTNSRAALAETWIRGDGGWLLLRVNADVMVSP
jgi:hypothetical protein